MARKSWRCFHCDEVFTNPKHAAEHFGAEMHDTPACKLGATKGHLITLIRKLQRELSSYRHEDSDIMRSMLSMLSMESEHQQQMIREEEKGYARGLADAKLIEPEHKPPMFDRT